MKYRSRLAFQRADLLGLFSSTGLLRSSPIVWNVPSVPSSREGEMISPSVLVIALLAVIIASMHVRFRRATQEARISGNLLQLQLALERWRIKHGRYPYTVDEYQQLANGLHLPVLINPHDGTTVLSLVDWASQEDPQWGEIRYRYGTANGRDGDEGYTLQVYDERGRPLLMKESVVCVAIRPLAFAAAS